ncbi:MAG: riboflavin synthase [Rhodanobacteraceae bacterium]|nr:riboflavin synthase [Pseudomonadota bacterium]
MFTGIIQSIGRIVRIESHGGDLRLVIDAQQIELDDVAIGDSIAVSGVCLTVVEHNHATFAADVSNETLSLTTLGSLYDGDAVNLEKALRLSGRLGGHLVSGHVDGVGKIASIEPDARSHRWTIEAPPALARYIAAKGSICVDGVSLTVNDIENARFSVNLIPHTIDATTFGSRKASDVVNLEVDMMARYAQRLLAEYAH